MIKNEDITVVIQGPIHFGEDESNHEKWLTSQSVKSIRQHLPGSKIIFSTWKGQDAQKLDVDEVIYNDDPGRTVLAYDYKGNARPGNENRQIVSSRNGLMSVKTRYAMKLRADVILTGNAFLKYLDKFSLRNENDSLFKERVVVTSMYFRRSVGTRPVICCQSDWLQFGRIEDLLTIWDVPLLKDFPFDPEKIGQPQYFGAPHKTVRTAEQILCQSWLKKLDPNRPEVLYRMDGDTKARRYWDRFMASNLIVLDPPMFAVVVPQEHRHEVVSTNVMRYHDWLKLYRHYCDRKQDFPYIEYVKQLGFTRLLKYPGSLCRYIWAKVFKWHF